MVKSFKETKRNLTCLGMIQKFGKKYTEKPYHSKWKEGHKNLQTISCPFKKQQLLNMQNFKIGKFGIHYLCYYKINLGFSFKSKISSVIKTVSDSQHSMYMQLLRHTHSAESDI